MKKQTNPSRFDFTGFQIGIELIFGAVGALALIRWLGM
jgi:hypothetical protein